MMISKLNVATGIASLALVIGAGPAFAQYGNTRQNPGETQNQQTAAASSPTTSSDDIFTKKAAQSNLAEVKLGQLAEQKGTVPEVKNFGKRMVDDHTQNDRDLKNVATQENVALPTEMDKADQKTYDRLSKLSGDAFDRAYARDMVKNHSKDVSEFQKEAKDGQNEAIKNYAAQTVPVLQSHLDLAHQMEQAVNRSTSSNGSNSTVPVASASSSYPSNTNSLANTNSLGSTSR